MTHSVISILQRLTRSLAGSNVDFGKEHAMASRQTEIELYNYSEFVGSDEFLAFRGICQVGSSAPDFETLRLDDDRKVKLSDYWKKTDVVLEFGSLT